jgi:hypothetical protein
MDLATGWQKHLGVTGGYQLLYQDIYIGEVSIVTGPKGSGLMGNNDPGQEPTYEVWFPGAANPIGYLKLDEIKGIIKYMHQLEQERMVYSDKD